MFQVMVSGSCLYETDDDLIANGVAWNYRTIGWKNVSQKGRLSMPNRKLVLVQKIDKPRYGYWDGGAKDVFRWSVDKWGRRKVGSKHYVRVGSWEANQWFEVTESKTDKRTLTNALRHLRTITKVPFTYSWQEE